MLTVQKLRISTSYEELAPISIWTTICHWQKTGSVVLQREVFIHKLLLRYSILVFEYRHRALTIIVEEVSTLQHKIFYYTMKFAIEVSDRPIIKFEFTGYELAEILNSLGDDVLE